MQFNTAAASGIAGAAGAARLLPPGGAQFQILEGLGAVGEVLVRSYGATAAQATAALQSDRQIAWFEADSLKQIDAAVPNDTQFSQQWALDNTGQNGGTAGDDIDATQAWNITTGSRNVVVAVIDSGVDYTDPDLAANIWTNPNAGQDGFSGDLHGYNFVDNNGDPMDDNGHGTFVAGEIGAVGNNGVGVTGVNWNVTIMPLKFLDANGDGYTSDAIRAINYAMMERTEYGVNVRVINASWSSSQSDPGLNAAIQAAGNAGILFVAAAGNSASNNDVTPQYPANSGLANVVSVAASDSNDQLAAFSNYGANTVNLAAPGVDIYGTLPGGKYGYLSGTSMAAPEVAGVAALAWAADPNATVAQVRNAPAARRRQDSRLGRQGLQRRMPERLQHLETPDRSRAHARSHAHTGPGRRSDDRLPGRRRQLRSRRAAMFRSWPKGSRPAAARLPASRSIATATATANGTPATR